MMNKLSGKKFSLFAALSLVVIVAGIILYSLLGFNTAPDRRKSYTFEVKYEMLLQVFDQEDDLCDLCETNFEKGGVSYKSREITSSIDASSFSNTTDMVLVYTFGADVDVTVLDDCARAVNAHEFTDAEGTQTAFVHASYHANSGFAFSTAAWRGAIAIAVAAFVALAYLTIRFGVSCGVAGLVCCLHDTLFTLAVFAITRFPVYGFMPVLYAAVAAFVSVSLWMVFCIAMRQNFKSPDFASLSRSEIVRETVKRTRKPFFAVAIVFAAAIAVIGAIGVAGTALSILPALVGVAVPVYSALLIGPEVCAMLQKRLDKWRASKKKGYVGKKKAAAQESDPE